MASKRKLTRNNLLVENAKVKALARLRGTSESGSVRDAGDFALAAKEMVIVIRQLHALGGIDDVFHKLPDTLDHDLQPRNHLADVLIIVSAARLKGEVISANARHLHPWIRLAQRGGMKVILAD